MKESRQGLQPKKVPKDPRRSVRQIICREPFLCQGNQTFSSCVWTRCCWGRKWDWVCRGAGSVCSVPAGAQHRRYSLTQNLVFLPEKKGGLQADSTDCSPDLPANFYINRRRFMKR